MNLKNDNEKEIWAYVLEMIIGSISCICSFFIFLKFLLNKEIRSYAFELVVCLSVASFFNSFSYLFYYIGSPDQIIDTVRCNFQAFTIIWFETSQVVWATIITIYTFKTTFNYYHDDTVPLWRRGLTIFLGFIVTMLWPIVGLVNDALGPSGKWCWINVSKPINFFIVSHYSLIWLMIVSNLIMLIVIKCRKTETKLNDRELVNQFINRLILFPLVSFIGWLPGTIERLKSRVSGSPEIWLEIIQLIFIHLQGITYAMIILYDAGIKDYILDFLSRCSCCNGYNKNKIALDRISLRSSTNGMMTNDSFL